MHYQFQTQRRIDFSQTDAAGLVHFSTYLLWMESVEHQFLSELGVEPLQHKDGCCVGWPRVNVACSWHAPLRFEDQEVTVHLIVCEMRRRSVRYGFHFYKETAVGRVHCATGQLTSVYATLSGDSIQTQALPATMRSRMQEAPQELQPTV